MQIGSMEILGTINVEGIKMGLSQMKNSLESSKVQAKSLFGDMERLGKSTAAVGKTMAVAGAGFLGTLIGLASVGPQTAVAMEMLKMNLEFLGMAIDDSVAPAVEFFTERIKDLTKFASENKWAVDLAVQAATVAVALGVTGMAYKAIVGIGAAILALPLAKAFIFTVAAAGAIATLVLLNELLTNLREKTISGVNKEFDYEDPYMGQGTQTSEGKVPFFPELRGGSETLETSGVTGGGKSFGGNIMENYQSNKTLESVDKGIWELVTVFDTYNTSGNRPSN